MKQTKDCSKFRVIKNEFETKINLKRRCRELLGSVEKEVRMKQIERTTKIQSFYDVLSRKQMGQHHREIRTREIEGVMIAAMTDKPTEEK